MTGISASMLPPPSPSPTKLRLTHCFHLNLKKTRPDNGLKGPLHFGVKLLSLFLCWTRCTPDSWPWSWLLPPSGIFFLRTSTHHSSSSFKSLFECWLHKSYFLIAFCGSHLPTQTHTVPTPAPLHLRPYSYHPMYNIFHVSIFLFFYLLHTIWQCKLCGGRNFYLCGYWCISRAGNDAWNKLYA